MGACGFLVDRCSGSTRKLWLRDVDIHLLDCRHVLRAGRWGVLVVGEMLKVKWRTGLWLWLPFMLTGLIRKRRTMEILNSRILPAIVRGFVERGRHGHSPLTVVPYSTHALPLRSLPTCARSRANVLAQGTNMQTRYISNRRPSLGTSSTSSESRCTRKRCFRLYLRTNWCNSVGSSTTIVRSNSTASDGAGCQGTAARGLSVTTWLGVVRSGRPHSRHARPYTRRYYH